MDQELTKQLQALFLETSRGAARNKMYALRAKKEGNLGLAALFTAISLSEDAQARRFLVQLRGQTGNSSTNILKSFTEEIPTTITLYEAAAQQAENCRDKAIHSACSQSARVQRMHLSLNKKLERKMASPENTSDSSYHICRFCGFIMEGQAPETCPICTAPTSRFTEIKQ